MQHLIIIAVVFMAALPGYSQLCIAHRGDVTEHAENTLEAIAAAWDWHADLVEVDVRLLKDGQVVLFHDPDIDGAHLRTLSYAQLQARLPDRHVPTLAATLTAAEPGQVLLLDLKEDARPFLDRVVSLLRERRSAETRTMLQSRSLPALRYLRAELPPETQLLFVTSLNRNGVRQAAPDAAQLAATLVREKLNGVAAKGRSFVNRKYVRAFRDQGLKYFVWTINDPARMRFYADAGVDGIITDAPANARAVLRDRRSP